MWQENNSSWYNYDGEKEEMLASVIYHNKNDSVHPNCYGVQIHSIDGGLVVIGYIKEGNFDDTLAIAIANQALQEKQTYEWWCENYFEWWNKNVVLA